MIDYKFSDEHRRYMQEQVWEAREDLLIYARLSEHEHEQLLPFLPQSPRRIMDMGCGMGRVAVYLNHFYNDPAIEYILADRTGNTINEGQYGPDNDEVYNDLALTASFAELNGVRKYKTFDTEKDNWKNLRDVDFITSRCAIGFHVPIDRYLHRLLACATPDCTMIFGIRNYLSYAEGTELRAQAAQFFEEIIYIPTAAQEPFPGQHWVIMRGKK